MGFFFAPRGYSLSRKKETTVVEKTTIVKIQGIFK
jgi:hypothetical protein